MKKTKVFVLMLALVTLLAGCGNTSNEESENTQTTTIPSQSETTSEETDNNGSEAIRDTKNAGSSVLIAYFSRIGNIDSEYEIDAISSASVVTQDDDLLGNMEYISVMSTCQGKRSDAMAVWQIMSVPVDRQTSQE